MTKKLTKKTVHLESVEGSDQASVVNHEHQDNHKVANKWFLVLMVVAGVVSGVLSYIGADSIYNAWYISIPFAIVVEGVIVVSLWLLPKRTVFQKALLMSIWAIAVSFSVFSAHLYAYKGTVAQRDSQSARNQVATFVSKITGKGEALHTKYKEAIADAQAEADGRNGPRGKGPKYKRLLILAEEAEIAHKSFKESTRKPIATAMDELRTVDSLADSQAIYLDLVAEVPAVYLEGIDAPKFVEESPKNPLKVILSLLGALQDIFSHESVSDGKAMEVMALVVASLMEALALLIGFARVILLSPIKKTSPILQRMRTWFESFFHAQHVWDDARENVNRDRANRKKEPRDAPKQNKSKREKSPSTEQRIQNAVETDAHQRNVPPIKVYQEVAVLRGTRRGGAKSVETFKLDDFKNLEATLRSLEIIDAVKHYSDDKIVVSTKWEYMMDYVHSQTSKMISGKTATSSSSVFKRANRKAA